MPEIDRGIRYRFRKSEAWIGKKIEHLEHEHKGRSHEQNIAIAESMAGNSKAKKNAATNVRETHSRKESAGGGCHKALCSAVCDLKKFAHGG